MNRRRFLLAGATVGTLGLTGLGAAAVTAGSDGDDSEPTSPDSDTTPPPIATAQVERRTLSESKEFNANVQYESAFDLPLSRQGTITARPDRGTLIEFGNEIVRVDLTPTFLAEGNLPMFRELKKTPDRRVAGQRYMTGYDVGQLQAFLIDAGFDDDGEVTVDGTFGPATERAVKAWQKAYGIEETGRVDSTQVLFSPTPLRIETTPRVGSPFSTIRVTEPGQRITFSVQSRDRALAAAGSSVEVAAPDGTSVPGVVEKLERTLDESGNASLTVTITADDPLPADTTTAVVTATRVLADEALAVPVTALLAVREGGFAVELATSTAATGTDVGTPTRGTLVRVDVGAIADGWAEVTGDVTEGDDVVVAQ
ncbi:MAG: peptidoglycan-binding domain-containing protein [Actinomycetota bacterium]